MMFSKDLFSKLDVISAMAPAVVTATPADVILDLQDTRAAMFALVTGVGGITFTGANRIDWTVRHGDAVSGAAPTWAQMASVPAADLKVDGLATLPIANGIVRSIQAAHAAPTVMNVGYIGPRRYVAVRAEFAGTHATGTLVAALLLRGGPRLLPPR